MPIFENTKVIVSGATGFVGRAILRELVARGYRVRALARHPERIEKEWNRVGCERRQHSQIEFCAADTTKPASLRGVCDGAQAVIHLVGAISQTPQLPFEKIHVESTANLLKEAKAASVRRWIQMSALGTRPHAASLYHQTKWQAEELVRASGLDWTIFRPSIIFGKEDRFINLFKRFFQPPISCFTGGAVACFGDGTNRLQLIAVEDVAHCFVSALSNPLAIGETFDLCGSSYTFSEILEKIAHSLGLKAHALHKKHGDSSICFVPFYLLIGKRPCIFSIPWPLAYVLAGIIETSREALWHVLPSNLRYRLPPPFLTPDMLTMLGEDQFGDSTPAQEIFNFKPRPWPS